MKLSSVLFGSGGGSQSSSTSNQYGESRSSSFGETGSTSTQTGRSGSQQRLAFEELFASLYGGAGRAASAVNAGGLAETAQQLFTGGLTFLEGLGGGAGADALEARIGDTTARDAQLETLRGELGELFNEELMPGVTSLGVSTGTLGGSRDSVLRAQAAKAVAGQFSKGAAGIISADQAQRDNAAATVARLKQSGAAGGLDALSSLYGLAEGGELAGLMPFQILAQIMGDPTVLGESFSEELGLSESFGRQGSQSYGFDYGTSTSSSTSKGPTQGLAQAFLGGGGLSMGFKF